MIECHIYIFFYWVSNQSLENSENQDIKQDIPQDYTQDNSQESKARRH